MFTATSAEGARDHLPPGSAKAIYSDWTGGPMTTQSRRRLLQALVAGTAAYTVPGLFAEALKTTVSLGEGPFYPDKMPLDTDNDLLVLNEGITPAVGEIAYVSGRLLTKSGEPLRNGYVEIWQTDTNGSYLHSGGRNIAGCVSRFLVDCLVFALLPIPAMFLKGLPS